MDNIQEVNLRSDIMEPLIGIQNILSEKSVFLKKLIENEGINDIRIITMENIRIDIVKIGLLFCATAITTNDDIFPAFQKIIDNYKAKKGELQKEMNDYIRLSILIIVHFKIEHLFAILLKKINKFPEKDRSFKKYINVLLANNILTQNDHKTLETLAYMRNCFHNGGKYSSKKDHTHKIDEVSFEFKKDKEIDYSIKHVFAVLEGSIIIVCNILTKKPFIDIIEEIGDVPD